MISVLMALVIEGRVSEFRLMLLKVDKDILKIEELLQMAVGSVLELNKAASSPLNVYANQTLVATGEVVVVGEHYGIRISDIVSPQERVQRLGNGA